MDWAQVSHFVDHSKKLTTFQQGPGGDKAAKTPWYRKGWALHVTAWASCLSKSKNSKSAKVAGRKGVADGEKGKAEEHPHGLVRKKSWSSAMGKILGRPMVSVEGDDGASNHSGMANGGGLGLVGIPEGEVHHGEPLDGTLGELELGTGVGRQQRGGIYEELGRPSVWAGMGPSRVSPFAQADIESAVEEEGVQQKKHRGSGSSGRRFRRSKSSRKPLALGKRPSTVDEDGEDGVAASGVESDTSSRSSSSSRRSSSSSDEDSGGLLEGVLPMLVQKDFADNEQPFCNWQRKPVGDSKRDLMKGNKGQTGRQQQQSQHASQQRGSKGHQPEEQKAVEDSLPKPIAATAGGAAGAEVGSGSPKRRSEAVPPRVRSLASYSVGAAGSTSGRSQSSHGPVDGVNSTPGPSPFTTPAPPAAAAGPAARSFNGGVGVSPGGWSVGMDGAISGKGSSVAPGASGHRPLEQADRALGRRSIDYGAAAAYRAAQREERALGTHSVSVAGRYGGGTEGGKSGSGAAGAGGEGEAEGEGGGGTGVAIPGLPPLGLALGRAALPGGPNRGPFALEQQGGMGIPRPGSEGYLSQMDSRKPPAAQRSSLVESGEKSLATRSTFVVPAGTSAMHTIAPSLAKMSTGLGRGVNPMMAGGIGSSAGYSRGTSPAVATAGGPSIAAASAPLMRVSQKSRKGVGSEGMGGSGGLKWAGGSTGGEGMLDSISRMSRKIAGSRVSSTLSIDQSMLEEEEELADGRSWLVSGLKRYFHAKRMEGLLSAQGLRILDSSCDMLLENPHEPLGLWELLQR